MAEKEEILIKAGLKVDRGGGAELVLLLQVVLTTGSCFQRKLQKYGIVKVGKDL